MLALKGHGKKIMRSAARTVSGKVEGAEVDEVDEVVQKIDRLQQLEVGTMHMAESYIKDAVRSHLEFSWEDAAGRMVYNLENEVDSIRAMTYCLRRDEYRAVQGRPVRWFGVPSQLAADMWSMNKMAVGERARVVRIIWDKHWNGENQVKAGSSAPSMCRHCGAVSGQKHMVEACLHPLIVRIRDQAMVDFDMARSQFDESSKEARILEIVADMMAFEEWYSIWTGMWTKGVRERYDQQQGHQQLLVASEYKRVVKALKILAVAVDKMMSVDQTVNEFMVTEVVTVVRRKRSIGGQRTLEELGWSPKRSHVEVVGLRGPARNSEAATANDGRVPRHRVRHIREDDSSQFDVG
jgi:hypothetical protein